MVVGTSHHRAHGGMARAQADADGGEAGSRTTKRSVVFITIVGWILKE